MNWNRNVSRLDFLKAAAMSGVGMLVPGVLRAREPLDLHTASTPAAKGESVMNMPFAARDRIRVGLIGYGGRGTVLMSNFLATGFVDITAICDIVPSKVEAGKAAVTKAGQKEPAGYSGGDRDYENLLRRDDVDLAVIATPWDWHVPMAVFAMQHGKHAATEVPAATTVEDCWKLVDTSEETRRHCMMLENCCYGYSEMLVLNMVRQGVFGTLVHGEGAYIHDLRSELFSNGGEGLWRRTERVKRNGNLYPTHGLGPVAHYMSINRGDRFETMVTLASLEAGLTEYRKEHVPAGDPRWNETYRCGDMNTSVIRTAQGRTIMVQHDVVNPQPYSRINMIKGTKGMFQGYPDRLFLDGQKMEDWQTLDAYKQYESPVWTKIGDLAKRLGGHGGMDFVMAYRLVNAMRNGLVPDMDVYDAASWSVPSPLSEASVKKSGQPQQFPDFTRGRWTDRKPSGMV
jgi:predicted dehydrogenase